MTVEYRVISIGTLSRHRLWSESTAVRTAHATTTLVTDGDRLILVDPSLPAQVLAARFNERTGKILSDVTDVFCTTLRPCHRRALAGLEHADWWVAELELETYRSHLEALADSAERLDAQQADTMDDIRDDLKRIANFRPAPEQFAPQIHFYPLTGASPGSAGLLLTPATSTIVIAGDAALTGEHVASAQIWQGSFDTDKALESLRDLLELADVIVPGHDNVIVSPARWM